MADNDIRFSRIPKDAAERWQVVCDAIAGDQAVRKYLPVLNPSDTSEENAQRNKAYRDGAVLYTATSFTLAGMIGLAFRHEPKHNLPEALRFLLKDADGAGVSVYQQSQAVTARVLGIGRHGLYVDFSAALGRPVIKSYCAEDVINWRTSSEGGRTVLSLLVLREEAEQTDEYAVECVPQWRELWLEDGVCKCRLWRLDDAGEPKPVAVRNAEGVEVDELVLRSSAAPLDFIPFVFVGAQNNDPGIDDSPLYGLAKINIAHFKNSADYEDSVFIVGQVQPWISGLDVEWRDHLEKQGSMYIGSRKPMLLPEKGAMGFAQAQPNMLAKEAMAHKEAQMVALGARLIDKQTAIKTATQASGDREASTSILALCVSNVSEAYQQAIRWCARYLDKVLPEGEDLYEINQDYVSLASDAPTIAALVAAWQQGLMAKSDVRGFFRRQGTIDPDRTDEQIDADLQAEPKSPLPVDPPKPAPEPAVPALLKTPPAPPPTPPAPLDLSPIVAAIRESRSEPVDLAALAALLKPADLSSIVEAMRAMPAPVVNLPEIKVEAPITVNVPEQPAPQVTFAQGAINVESPAVNVTPAPITVEGATINVQPAQVIQQKASKATFQLDDEGNPIGATLN